MNDRQLTADALPDWIQRLGVATWVSGPDGRVLYANERAETMLGTTIPHMLGKPCHEVVGGKDSEGRTWCSEHCPVDRMVDAGEEIEPYTIRVEGGDGEHWVQMLVIPFEHEGAGGTCLAHCAFNVDKQHLIESYLDRIAARTPLNNEREFDLEKSRLSKREREVLDLLSKDQNLYAISEKLNVSYYTVRNHVQHILGKMGVHSTLEAVALYLLAKSKAAEGE
jgi:DNA-binding CsgD family transcriptional regulator